MFMLKKRTCRAMVLVCLALTLSGCSAIQRLTMIPSGFSTIRCLETDFVSPMISALVDQASDAGSLKLVREGIGANALLVSSFAEISPNNRLLLAKTAYLFCAYGLLVEDEDPEFASELYTLGKQYGLRSLEQNRCFKKGLGCGRHISELTGCLGKKEREAALWTGVATGLWIFRNMEDSAALIEIDDAVALVQRSLELDDQYFFGLGKIFLGSYYALIPDFFGTGGGPEAAARMFTEARAVSNGKLLLADVWEARFLDTQLKNREEYIRKLEGVLAADPDILEGYRMLTAIAKLKARYFLDHRDEFF